MKMSTSSRIFSSFVVPGTGMLVTTYFRDGSDDRFYRLSRPMRKMQSVVDDPVGRLRSGGFPDMNHFAIFAFHCGGNDVKHLLLFEIQPV